MSLTAVSALLVGSLGLHLSHHPDVPLPRALMVVDRLAAQIEGRGTSTVVDDPLWTPCKAGDGCEARVRAHLETPQVAFLSIYEGARTMRVVARVGGREHRVQLPLDPADWAEGLTRLAMALVPTPRSATSSTTFAATGPPPRATRWAPWLLGAGALATAGVGIGFGLSARGAQDGLREGPLLQAEAQDLRSRQSGHAWAANILIGSAVALTAGAVITWLTD